MLLCIGMLALPLSAQTDAMVHVKAFPGVTVGDKVTAAQATCPAAPSPCYLILDASLAAYAPGTMPTLVSNAQIVDFRTQWPGGSPVANAPVTTNGLVSGGGVVWKGGLNFTISAATYYIGGVLYNSAQTDVTLATADPANPRIDEFYVNSSSLAGVITGTPSATPSTPSVDVTTQIALGSALIPANATAPSGVSTTPVYRDNADWTCSVSDPSWNCASTNAPLSGTLNIVGKSWLGSTPTNDVQLVGPGVSLSNYTSLTFYLKNDLGSWPKGSSLLIWFQNGTSMVGQLVSLSNGAYGLNTGNSAYQQIVIPTSAFGTGSSTVTSLLIEGNWNRNQSIQVDLDEIYLQAGLSSGSGGSPGIANSSFAVGTSAISANACTVAATVSMPGLTASSALIISPAADLSGVTGWGSTGGLVVDAWPTSGTFNYKVCNQTNSSITPSGSATFNVGAR